MNKLTPHETGFIALREIKLWKQLLNNYEITKSMSAQLHNPQLFNKLVSYIKFDEGEGMYFHEKGFGFKQKHKLKLISYQFDDDNYASDAIVLPPYWESFDNLSIDPFYYLNHVHRSFSASQQSKLDFE